MAVATNLDAGNELVGSPLGGLYHAGGDRMPQWHYDDFPLLALDAA